MERMTLYSFMFGAIIFSKFVAEGKITCFYSSDVLQSSDLHSSLCTYISDLSSDPVQNTIATSAFDSSNSNFDISTTFNLESSASDINDPETNSISSTHFYSDTSDTPVDLTSLGTDLSSFSPLVSATQTSDIKSTDFETSGNFMSSDVSSSTYSVNAETNLNSKILGPSLVNSLSTDTESIGVSSSIIASEIFPSSNDDQSNTDPLLSTMVETSLTRNDYSESNEISYASSDISESSKTSFESNDISDSAKSTSASSSQDMTVDTTMFYTSDSSLTQAYDPSTLVSEMDSSELSVSPTLPPSSVEVSRSSSAVDEIISSTLGVGVSLFSSFAETSTPETATPETSTPETATPETSTPETSTPETSTLVVESSLVELSNNSIVMVSLESSEPSLFLSESTNQGLEITSVELSQSSVVLFSLLSSTPELAVSDISITRETETLSLESISIFSSDISDQVASTEAFTSSTELSDLSQTIYTNTETLETSSSTGSESSIEMVTTDQTTPCLTLSDTTDYTVSASLASETSAAAVSENSHVLSTELIAPSLTLSDTSDFTVSTTTASETKTTTVSTESMSPSLISDTSDSTLSISTPAETNSAALTDSFIVMVSSESIALTVSRSDSLDTIATDFSTSASETVIGTDLGSSLTPISTHSATPNLASSDFLHSILSATLTLDTNTVAVTESSNVVVSLTPSLTTSQPTSHLEIESSSTNWITPSATLNSTPTTPSATLSSTATTPSATLSSTFTTPSATLSSTFTTPSATLSSTATTPSVTLSSTATTPSATLSSTATTPSLTDLNTTSAITSTTTSTVLPLETEERNVTFEFNLDANVTITDNLKRDIEAQLLNLFRPWMKDLQGVHIYNVSVDPRQRSFKLKADVGFILDSRNSIQQLTTGLTKYKDEKQNHPLMLGTVNATLADIKVNNVSFSSLNDDCEKAKHISGCRDSCDDPRVEEVCRKSDNIDDLIIGLAVGIPLFVLTSLLISLLVCIYRRRKRKEKYMDEKDMPDIYMGNLFASSFAKQNMRYPNGEYDKISNGSSNGSYSSKKKVPKTTSGDEQSRWYNSLQHQPKSGFKGNFSWDFLYSGETFKIQRPKLNALSTDL
ncbi:serine-rich adhesin for platelets-like [Biomphalaria glabrata]|uniref:Serine-rich adhesin for platelets-like n=1 Tax=Biomphalaria glabrata TaxID=6526 RepID=A0A9W2YBB9_BIOGL|nr:serine-rich adhesin for platelets-like [Biomphalaria glabrata]